MPALPHACGDAAGIMRPPFRGESMHARLRLIVRTLAPLGTSTAMKSARAVAMGVAMPVAMAIATTAAVSITSAAPARAYDELEPAGPSSASTPSDEGPIVDRSKHGTVEAEIPATRESTSPPPTREELKSRLTDPLWPRGTFFIGIAGHYAFEVTDQIGDLTMLAPGGGASMRLGIRHNRFWSSEFSGLWTSKFKDAGVEYNGFGVYMGERFYFTKTRWQPYIGAHVGFLRLEGTNFDGFQFGFSPKFNAGLEFFVTETLNVGLDASYHYTVGAIENSDFVTVSLGVNWF